jgi:hypothetical protein
MAVFTWQSGSTGTGTFDVVTRSGSYTSASQLIARSGTYSIDTQVSLRSGSVTLYQQSSGYVTSPMTAFDIMFDRSILSPIINTPFNNNVYNTALYKNTQIYKSVNAYVDPSSIVFDDALINSEKDLKFISDTLVFAPYRFSASGSINASNQASAKVTFKPAGGTGLFTISGQSVVKATRALFVTSNNILELVDASSTFEGAGWGKSNISVIGNTISGLDGTLTADKLVENTANAQHFVSFGKFGYNETITFSVFVKAAERTQVFLQLSNFVNATAEASYNLSTGTAGTPSSNNADYTNASTSIVPYPNGWYRCILTATKGSVNTTNAPTISIFNSGSIIYTGDGTSGIYVWGAKVERGSVATPYQNEYLYSIGNSILTDNFINTSGTATTIVSNKFSGSGTINASNQASAKVTFDPADGTGLFTFAGPLKSQSTTQYDHRTNVLTNAVKYAINDASVASNTSILNPITGLTGDIGVHNFINTVSADSGYITPISSTGTFATNTVVVMSVFAKANTFDKFCLLAYNDKFGPSSGLPNQEVRFNLTSGTAANLQPSNIPLSYGIIPYSNGWYRCWIKVYTSVATDQSTGAGWFQIRFSGGSVVNSSIYVYGPQLQKDILTSYVENITTGALTTTAYLEYPVTSTSFKLSAGGGTINVSGTARITSPYIVSGSVTLSGSVVQNRRSIIPAGSGTISISNQASAKVTFDPADGTGLFAFSNGYSNIKASTSFNTVTSTVINIDGTSNTRILKNFSGSGTFTESGTASQATARVAFIPINTIILYNTNAITKLAMQYAGKSPTTPFGGLDIIFEELEANAPPQQFKYTGSASAPKTTVKISSTGILQISGTGSYTANQASLAGSGSISLSGQHGVNVFKPNWITSGTINVSNQASARVLFRPADGTGLFTFTNGYSNFKATSTYLKPKQNLLTNSNNFSDGIWFGYCGDKTNLTYNTTEVFAPDGTNTSTKIVRGTNPCGTGPSFGVIWSDLPQVIDNTNTFTASIFVRGAVGGESVAMGLSDGRDANYILTTSWQRISYTGINDTTDYNKFRSFQIRSFYVNQTYYIYGAKVEYGNTTSQYVTSNGVVLSDNIVNPISLSVSGAAGIKAPNRHIGASPIAYYDPSEIVFGEGDIFYATQFKITSQSQYTRLNKLQSSGSLFAASGAAQSTGSKPAEQTGLFTISNGYSNLKATESWLGSGTINASNQASAAVSFKANDGTGLFTFTNGYSNLKATESWLGIGTTTFNGAAGIKAPNRHIGASPIAYYDPSEIVFGEGDIFYATQFKIASFQSLYRFVQGPVSYQSSGSLFALGGAAQSTRFKPADGTGLFGISGQHGVNVFKPNWITSGTINASNQASAKVTFKPTDGTGLFTFTNGYSNLKATDAWLGSGTINASNQASAAVLFKPANGTGLFTFVGSVVQNRTSIIPAGSGTITLSGAYSNLKATDAWLGSGSTTFSNGYSNLKATEVWVGSGTTTFSGAAGTKSINKHIGASPIAYYDPNEIVFGEGDIFYATQFKITSQSQYTKSNKLQSSGSLFAVSGASQSIAFKPAEQTGLFIVSGSVVEKQIDIASGSGTINASNQASAAVSFKPAGGTGLFVFTNGYSNLKASSVWIGTGTATFSGAAGIKAPNRHIGASPIAYYDPNEIVFGEGDIFYATEFKIASFQSLYRFIQGPVSYQSSGSLFAVGGASQSTRFKPADGTGLFTFSGQHGANVFKPNWITSGTITFSQQASAKVTFKPADGTGLFTFTNGYSNLKATESWLGSGTINVGEQATASVSFKPAGGTGLFAFTNGYTNLNATTRPAAGSGTITLSGAYSNLISVDAWNGSGSVTLSGAAVLKQRNVSIDGSGTATFSGTAIQKVANKHIGASPIAYYDPSEIVFGEGDIFYATQFKITSQSQYTRLNKPPQTTGSLFAVSGASNSTSFKASDGTGLFTFTNAAVQKHIDIASGSGTITLSGAAVLPLFAKYSGSGSTTLSGSIVESQTDRPAAGSGTISISQQASATVSFNPTEDTYLFSISGNAVQKHIDVATGSGTISSLSGGAERVAFKSADGTGLFTFSNGYSNLNASSVWVGTGTATFSGAAGIKAPNRHIGASPIAYYDPSEIVFGEGDIFYATELKITSFQSQYRFIQGPVSYQSSGSLFAVGGASQSTRFKPADGTGLFTFSGQHGANVFKPNWITSGTINASNQASAAVSFKAVDGTGLFTFTNSAVLKQTNISIDGSGTISSLSGGAEKVTFKPAGGTGLFAFSNGYSNLQATTRPAAGSGTITLSGTYSNFTAASAWNGSGSVTLSGAAGQKHTDIASGSGTITLSGDARLPLFAKYSGSGSATMSGSLVESQTDRPAAGSGTITLSGAYSNLSSVDAWNGSGSVTLSGAAGQKHIDIASGSGSISSLSGGAAKVTFNPPEDTYLFSISGQHGNNVFKPNWITSGTINISQQASAAVSFKALDGTGLFTFTNSAVPKQTNIALAGSGTITLSGAAVLPLFAKYSGSGSVTLSGSLVERETNRISGSGTINASNQASAAVSFKANDGTGLFAFTNGYSNLKATNISIDGSGSLFSSGFFSNLKVAFRSSGTGLFTFSGQHGDNVFKPNWITSGAISISNQAAAAVSFKAVDGTGLFTFTNSAVLKKTNISIDGSGTINASNQASAKVTFKEVNVTGLFSVSGTVTERETNRPAAGSGTISISNQASAAVLFRPVDGTGLFTFTNGYSNLKSVDAWLGSGTATLSGSVVEKQRQVALGSGSATLSGTVTESETNRPAAGSGTISISNQASAAVSFKPAEGTGLFTFTNGYSNLKATEVWLGSGSVTIDSTSTAKVVWVPSAGTGLFDITGTAGIKLRDWIFVSPIVEFDPYELIINDDFVVTDIIKLYQRWNATNNVEGSSAVSSTNIYESSGSLFADSTASATVTFNPTEGDPFFVVSGSALDSHTEVAVASGTATISGSVVQNQTNLPPAGSGTIITSNLASAKVTFKPADGTGLFSVSGSVVETQTEVAAGSGTINTSDQASAAVSFKAVDGTGLFTFSGSVVEKQTDITSGSGTINISDQSSARVTFKPADGTGLFAFFGSVVETQTEVAIGSGSITISGNAIVPLFAKYFGSGSATISGSAGENKTSIPRVVLKAITIYNFGSSVAVSFKPADGTGLFAFSGSVVETQTEVAAGSGTIDISKLAIAKVTFKPADGTGLFAFSGFVVQSQTNLPAAGSGTISISEQASAKVTFKPADGTGLFVFSGSVVETQTEVAAGSGSVTISGNVLVPLFAKYSGSGSATISGNVVDKQTDITSGSGTINISEQASAKVTFKPADGTGLFSVFGSVVERQTNLPAAGSGLITISGNVIVSVVAKYSGSGSATLSGNAVEKHTDRTTGSGTISISEQASAKVTFKPADGTGLFSISGQHGNNVFKPNWITSGTINISNQASAAVSFKAVDGTGLFTFTNGYNNLKATTKPEAGSGTIIISEQASAKITFKPADGIGLFSISGNAVDNYTNRTSGSGTINISNQSSAAVSFKAVDGTGLFTFTNGYSNLNVTIKPEDGSGTILFSSSASAKVTFNPVEDTYLFDISGSAVENKTETIFGSGIINISEQASAAVSFNPPEDTFLYEFSGSYSDLKATSVWDGSGTLFGSGFSSDIKVTFSSESTALFEISGEAEATIPNKQIGAGRIQISGNALLRATKKLPPVSGVTFISGGSSNTNQYSNVGSGSLFSIGSSPETRTFTWQTEPREISYLFSGAAEYDHVTSYESTILLNISGSAIVRTVLPEKIFATII